MQIIRRKVPNNFNIFLIGDEHVGSLMYHEDGWDQMVDMVHSPYDGATHNIIVDHGDAIEAIKTDDPRFQSETTRFANILQQAEYAKQSRASIQKQLVTILNGNHEAKLHRFGDIMDHLICKPLSVPYGTYSCHITYHDKDGNDIMKHFAFHGAGSIQSIADDAVRRAANRQLSLKRKMKEQFGDTALMTMGHCFSDDTELLTDSGWKKYHEIKTSDKALTFNINNGVAEYQPIRAKYIHKDKFEKILRFENPCVDIDVTHDHRMVCAHHKEALEGKWAIRKASEIFNLSQFVVPVSGRSPNSDANISDDMVSLLGWLISEGHFRENGAVQLFQNKSQAGKIRTLLNKLQIPHSEYLRNFKGREFKDSRSGVEYKTKEDSVTFYITIENAAVIRRYITDKNIPPIIYSFSDRQFDLFFKAMMDGDGWMNRSGVSGVYYTSNKKLADDLQALCVQHGWYAKISSRRQGSYEVIVHKATSRVLFKQNGARKEVDAPGVVWCVSVDNGTLFVRKNGKAFVCGNTHQLHVTEPVKTLFLTVENDTIRQNYTSNISTGEYIHPDHRWYVNTGSFMRLYGDMGVSGYAERAGYDPIMLGFAVAKVRDRKLVGVDKVYT